MLHSNSGANSQIIKVVNVYVVLLGVENGTRC